MKHLAIAAVAALGVAAGTAAAGPDKGTGTISGVVVWKGEAPARAAIDRSSDPVCAKTPRTSEDIVVESGKLRDVMVRLPVGSAGAHAPPAAPAVLVQSECMYGPRVVGVLAGQALEVRNADPTFHNTRGTLGQKVLWNLGQPAGEKPLTRAELGKAGDVIALHCDVHPWMAAWAVILDHPFFQVTAGDGKFELRDVPAGSYTLEAWHPLLGLQTAKVKVKKGKTAKVTFTFSAAKTK